MPGLKEQISAALMNNLAVKKTQEFSSNEKVDNSIGYLIGLLT